MQNFKEKPLDITFQDIHYSVMVKSEEQSSFCNTVMEKKQILRGISGVCMHGEMTAILGSSGAGKTSLLNILAKRINASDKVSIEGDLQINGQEYSSSDFGEFGNYVMQNDILSQVLTVKECLQFAGDFKTRAGDDKEARIDKLMKDLKLQKCADTCVGGPLVKGISGGQKKRTSIGFELMSDPQLIMLDEPTSGLDSFTALLIINYLRKLAEEEGRTVVMTIHQPSNDIFEQFNNVLLMVAGRLIYQGPYVSLINHFGSIGFLCPKHNNPADYLMSIMHPGNPKNLSNYDLYFQAYAKDNNYAAKRALCSQGDVPRRQFEVGFFSTLYTLLGREVKNLIRNPLSLRVKIVQAIVVGLLSGAIFWKLSAENTTSSLYNKAGAMFFIVMTVFMTNLTGVAVTFPLQRQVFLKEQGSKMYSTSAYFLTKSIMDLPFIFVLPILFIVIIYWMMGLNIISGERFGLFYIVVVVVGFCGSSFGFTLGAIFTEAKVVTLLINLCIMPLTLFSGFFKQRDSLPNWLGWIQYISPFKYALQAFMLNEYEERGLNVTPQNTLGMTDVNLAQSIIIIVALGVFFRIIAFTALYIKKDQLQ